LLILGGDFGQPEESRLRPLIRCPATALSNTTSE